MTKMNYGPRFGPNVTGGYSNRADIYASKALRFATEQQKMFWRAKAETTKNKHKITLAGPDLRIKKTKPGKERYEVEKRMAARLEKCADWLSFGILEMQQCSDVRNPRYGPSPLKVNTARLIELMNDLAHAAGYTPPIVEVERRPGNRSNKQCANCGAFYMGWHCVPCAEQAKNFRVSEQTAERRSREQNNRQIANDIKKSSRLLRDAERKNRNA